MQVSCIPADVLHEIFQQVDRPKDLLSLALTSGRFRDAVIPYHIEFRDISCDPHRISLWKTLASRPHLAAKFRALVLYPEVLVTLPHSQQSQRPPIVPRSLGELDILQTPTRRENKTSENSLHALKEAVKHMSGLKTFVWEYQRLGHYSPALGSLPTGAMLLMRDIFEAVVENCHQLKEVDVALSDDPFSDARLGKLSGLTRFSFAIFNCTNPMISVIHIFQLITKQCPDLVELAIKVSWGTWYSITELLKQGHWRHLQKLTLDGLDYNSQAYKLDMDIRALSMATFLERHPKLECLSLMSPGMLVRRSIFEGTLLRLRSLRYRELRYGVENELIIPSSLLERLEYFHPPCVTGEYPVDPSRTSMRAFASRIEDSCLPIVVGMFPKLERLEFLGPEANDYEAVDTRIRNMDEEDPRIEILSKLKRLTHLAGFLFSTIRHPIGSHTLKAKMSKLGALPSLQYVQYQVGSPRRREDKWIFIERGVDGTYTGFKYITPSGNVKPRYWGDFFENIRGMSM